MDGPLRAWLERTGVTRAELPGLLVAAAGSVIALVLALRLPLAGAVTGAVGLPPPVHPAPVSTPAPSPSPDVVLVHVSGAVDRPGVVTLVEGDRLEDAIAGAGGALADAALEAVNLARPVVDGERVDVPTLEEVAAGLVDLDGQTDGVPAGELPDGRLDLNTADVAQLEGLPGIGPVIAARVVAHRAEVGPFEQASALREVSGVGESIWADVRNLVGVAGEPAP